MSQMHNAHDLPTVDFSRFFNTELLVRKTLAGFIEKLFNYFGCKPNHDEIKKVLYGDDRFHSPIEERMKNAYDAYLYLLFNAKNPLTNRILNSFFYIYFGKEIEPSVSLRIATDWFKYVDAPAIEGAVDFHTDAYNEIDFTLEEDKLIISLMLLNYCLVKNDIPTIQLTHKNLDEYSEKRKLYLNGDKIQLYRFFFLFLLSSKVQSKEYYKNLKKLSLKDVYQLIKDDEELIEELFCIKHISVFGSFAKNISRIDSDIDLLVSFSLNLTSEQKKEKANNFKELYTHKFKRFVDLKEISEYLNDDFIANTSYAKKIF